MADIFISYSRKDKAFATRLPLSRLPGQLLNLAFSADSRFLAASGMYDDPGPYLNDLMRGSLMLYDLESGQLIAGRELAHGGIASALAFSEDRRLLKFIDEGIDGGVVVWELCSDLWQELACRIANRKLAKAEWQRYVIGEEYRQVCP